MEPTAASKSPGSKPLRQSNGSRANVIALRSMQGFAVHVLKNQNVELAVVPELGAKIISLKDLRTGREWMWHPEDKLRLFKNQLNDDFSLSPLVGVDECLPTIAPCVWLGRKLPDHGEAWSKPWQVDGQAWATGILTTRVRLEVSPFEFERTIELHGNSLQLSYKLKNLAAVEEHYLWALHPLLKLKSGDLLELPASTRRLTGKNWNGPITAAVAGNTCIKAFARPLVEGRAVIKNDASGDRLEFNWQPAENDTLGLWLTRGAWHGHHHFAIEPTNGADDSLAVAAAARQGGCVPAHDSVSWRVCLRVGN